MVPVEAEDVRLKHTPSVYTEVLSDRKIDKQIVAGDDTGIVCDKQPVHLEGEATRGQVEDGAWDHPRTQEEQIFIFALLCEEHLKMNGLDILECAYAFEGGLFSQFLGGKGLVAAVVAAFDDVDGLQDVLHARPGCCWRPSDILPAARRSKTT